MSGKEKKNAAAAKPASRPAKPRSIAEIAAEIEASRDHLVETVSQLQVAVKRTIDPKRIVAVQVDKVRGFYIDEYGGVRPERVVATVSVVVGFIVVRRVSKRVFSKD